MRSELIEVDEDEELVKKMMEYIDKRAIADGLLYNLKAIKRQYGVNTDITFEELKSFYLFILEDFWEQAKAYASTHYS